MFLFLFKNEISELFVKIDVAPRFNFSKFSKFDMAE